MEYQFIRLDKENLPKLGELYVLVYGELPSLDLLENTYNTEIFEKYTIGFLAVHTPTNEIAAYYGVFPLKARMRNEIHLVAQSGATMTSPKHQRKGLFTELAKITFETAKQEGVRFIFGFPNENSLPGFVKKLNWTFHGNMEQFKVKNSSFPLAEISKKFPIFSKIHYSIANTVLKKYRVERSIFAEEIANSEEASIVRDSDYLSYKSRGKGVHFIAINNFHISLSVTTHLFIGEVAEFDASRLDDFLKTISLLARKLNCGKTVFIFNEKYWLAKHLKRINETSTSLPIGFLNLSEGNIDFKGFSFTCLDYDTFI